MKGVSKTGKVVSLIALMLLSVDFVYHKSALAQEEPADDEIIVISCGMGRQPEGSFFKSQHIDVRNSDIAQQVGDLLIILRNNSLYSIALHPETDEPLEIISKLEVPGYSQKSGVYHYNILASEQLLIVLTETKDGADFTFFRVNSYGELDYSNRYSFSDEVYDIWSYLLTATIVDNTLVFIGQNEVVLEDDKPLSNFLSERIEASQLSEEGGVIKSDITLTRQWVNPIGAFDQSEGLTDIVVCPLDSFFDDGLACHVTSLVGVYSDSNFINDQAIYLWGEHYVGGHYGVISHSKNDYLERTDLELEVTLDSQKSTVYRVDLQYRDVTGVIVDGNPLNRASFEESDDQFFALVKKANTLEINNDLTYGLSIGVDQFSDLPVALPESDYQLLVDGEGRINANRFSRHQIVVSRSINSYGGSPTHEVIVWDTENESVVSVESEFRVDDLYFIDDSLITISNDNDGLKMQTWAMGEEVEPLFSTNYETLIVNDSKFENYFLGSHYGQKIWGLPVSRLDEEGNDIAQYVNRMGDSQNVQDMHYFQMTGGGTISSIGTLLAEPVEADVVDECDSICDDLYDIKRSYRIGDTFYSILGDEVLKGIYQQGGVSFNSRVNLFANEVDAE